jgi:hypothetical protein
MCDRDMGSRPPIPPDGHKAKEKLLCQIKAGHTMTNTMNFVSLDFETANPSCASICAAEAVKV